MILAVLETALASSPFGSVSIGPSRKCAILRSLPAFAAPPRGRLLNIGGGYCNGLVREPLDEYSAGTPLALSSEDWLQRFASYAQMHWKFPFLPPVWDISLYDSLLIEAIRVVP